MRPTRKGRAAQQCVKRGFTRASGGSGDEVTIGPPILAVPVDYVSGNALSDNSTYDNQTFGRLGVTPGTYVWTWGTGATADSFTLNIVPVPEPSSLALLALPLGLALLLAAWRRRTPSFWVRQLHIPRKC